MKEKLKKISENIYELPKEGKMLVPAKIFVSEFLFKGVEEECIKQVSNVAKLKGIIGNALVMPDVHVGYGFPIGGVAAFDIEKGIISPGGVGYDINCLTRDSRVLNEFGQSIKIEDFEGIKSETEIEQNGQVIKKILFASQLPTLNPTTNKIENKKINFFMFKESKEVYEITLNSGLKIKSTGEHPFLTKKGMVPLLSLDKNEELAVNLFEGVDDNLIIDEKEAITAKIIGYLMGDGTFYKSKNKLYAVAYGAILDLEAMYLDLERIGVKSKIFTRMRNHKIVTRYGEKKFVATNHELHIYSQEYLKLLSNLGLSLGNKTRQEINIPEWILKGNKTIKRLFLAGFFGAEMSSPSTSSKTCFYCPTINQNKIALLKQNCRNLFVQLALMIEEFGIKEYVISEMEDFVNKYNEKTSRLRLIIKEEENMLKLWRNIGFEYNQKRKNLANISSLYILLKKKENEKRIELASIIKEYKRKGFTLKEVQSALIGKINARFIERHYYEDAKQRISLDFESFKEFLNRKLAEIRKFGCIFDKIKEIKKVDGVHKVYDFNICDNHNFIANGFIVSNCGVRLLVANISKEEFLKKREQVLNEIFKNVPSGVGNGGELKLSDEEMKKVLEQGAKWAVEKGYGIKDDLKKIEDNGCLEGNADKVSSRAKARGRDQLGTIGSGNHFVEIQEVQEIFDEKTSKVFGVEKGGITIMIHTGSRGLGHQTASDYIHLMEKEYGFKKLPDRELVCAPINSKLGVDYREAMNASANFAFANRQIITSMIRKSFEKFFPKIKIELVYDVCHNIAKFEEHKIDEKKQMVCVHRKGATRSFGPGRNEIPSIYRKVGQPVIIPGSMGTFSYLLVGTKKAEEISLASTAHGAGRVMSRSSAIRDLNFDKMNKELNSNDILLKAGSKKGAVEESPEAYKDVNEVVRVSDELGIGNIVARMKPLAVIKG